MIGSLILGIALSCLMFFVSRKYFEEPKKIAVKRAVIAGLTLAVTNVIAIKAPAVLAVILILPMIGAFLYMYLWWDEEGSSIKELFFFFVMDLILTVVFNNVTVRVRDITSIRLIRAVAESFAVIALLMSVGFMVANTIWFKDKITDGGLFGRKEEKDYEVGRGDI